jgi:branched-chain amino acid transport system substrate-binding protein
VVEGDSGDTYTSVASQSVDRLLDRKVGAVVGATGSAVTATVIDKIVGAGVVQLSFGDLASTLTGYPDRGLYFRTAPPDVFEAQVLADAIHAAGHESVSILYTHDAPTVALADALVDAVHRTGGRATRVEYDGHNPNPTNAAYQLSLAGADANVVLGELDVRPVIDALVAGHAGPDVTPLYVSELALTSALTAGLPAAVSAGVLGVRPGAPVPVSFEQRVLAQDPSLADVGFAPQAYDAVVMLALAAQVARSTTGRGIATALAGITVGANACTSYTTCLDLVRKGLGIAYRGVGGTVPLDQSGEPTKASIGLFRWSAPGRLAGAGFAYRTEDVG